jgi:hypothetical protein
VDDAADSYYLLRGGPRDGEVVGVGRYLAPGTRLAYSSRFRRRWMNGTWIVTDERFSLRQAEYGLVAVFEAESRP